jgi:hypothetical protein
VGAYFRVLATKKNTKICRGYFRTGFRFSDKRQCSGSLLGNLRVTTQITIVGPRLSRCGWTPTSYLHKYRAQCVCIILTEIIINSDDLLTLHLNVILVINQLNAQKSSLNLCTGRPPTGVMISDAV